ncbi:hypothetical protein SPBR_07884 [Sporothrix brasiliensis 5110]|uniref:Uncharacterized protein n=1 Tax=Sporothrix brasiliensis 5110 TaxID=1398154 RepID=A0A0C2IUY1_9PEZI|nr:uncharacterized protein SPBR_07884 [Sporothrix brasiliensis 5110]KIH88802.1 hypothetical protein SPBR_07884 [Sporothrix brasiliensis 5110]
MPLCQLYLPFHAQTTLNPPSTPAKHHLVLRLLHHRCHTSSSTSTLTATTCARTDCIAFRPSALSLLFVASRRAHRWAIDLQRGPVPLTPVRPRDDSTVSTDIARIITTFAAQHHHEQLTRSSTLTALRRDTVPRRLRTKMLQPVRPPASSI